LPNVDKKPLTKEEIEEKKRLLRERVAKAREERTKQEATEDLAREKVRRLSAKETEDIKREHEMKSMEREAAARRREKEEEKKAKAAIKAKIDQDRKEREAKRTGVVAPTSTTTTTAPVTAPTPSAPVVTNYTDTMIQVKLPDGNSIKATFKATDPVRTVHNHIALLTGTEQFSLITTFPRKVYSPRDSAIDTTTLKQAEVVPSGTFIVTKL
jgi:FKBP-type peptidyl-prolyl cis-trans isomerase